MLVTVAPPHLLCEHSCSLYCSFYAFSSRSQSAPSARAAFFLFAVVYLVATILIASQIDASSCHDDKRHKLSAVNACCTTYARISSQWYLWSWKIDFVQIVSFARPRLSHFSSNPSAVSWFSSFYFLLLFTISLSSARIFIYLRCSLPVIFVVILRVHLLTKDQWHNKSHGVCRVPSIFHHFHLTFMSKIKMCAA